MIEKFETYPVYVEPFHSDFTGRITMGMLGNHMLNAAGKHANKRGWGISELNESKHTWVLSRLSIEMERVPRQYENIQIRTWVESVIKLFTNRNFAILDSEGNAMGYARSVWAMIDLETRRPCDLSTGVAGDILNYTVTEEENVCPITGHGRFRFRDAQLVRTIDTYYSDMDINGHINSIKYVEHILDIFPKEQFEHGIRRFEIAYKTESYMGDRLSLYRQDNEDGSIDVEVRKHVTDESAGEVVCQAKLMFNQ